MSRESFTYMHILTRYQQIHADTDIIPTDTGTYMHIPTQLRFKLPGPAVCQCGVTQPEARNSVASLRLLEHWKSRFKLAHWHYTCTCGTWKPELRLAHVPRHTAGTPAGPALPVPVTLADSDHLPEPVHRRGKPESPSLRVRLSAQPASPRRRWRPPGPWSRPACKASHA